MAVMPNGELFGMIKPKTVKSVDFTIFLMLREQVLEHVDAGLKKKAIMQADNARIHISKETRRVAAKIGIRFRFLPPYSPEYAPVELVFGLIKSKFREKSSTKRINFGKAEGMIEIAKIWKEIGRESIYR
jgi:transposase